MTVTVRIQYKGEGARKLAAEEHSQDRDVTLRYVEDMTRALSMFAIPVPPDSSKAIWKSGFVLCNYNTTRDTPLFDRIYRGAFRAQSIACKNTLEGLSISYIHLFENSKPIFFGKQAQQRSLSPTARTQTLRQKSPASSTYRHKTWTRPLGPERSAPELYNRSRVPDNGYKSYRALSLERNGNIKQEPFDVALPSSKARENGQDAEVTLKRLAGSQSLLALLGQSSSQISVGPSFDPSIKQEAVSPRRMEPPRAPRSLLASASSAESVTESSGRRPLSPPRPSFYHQRESRFSRPVPLEDRVEPGLHALNSNIAHNPQRGRSISPSYRGRSLQRDPPPRFAVHGEDSKHSLNGTSNTTYKSWYIHNKSPSQRSQRYSFSSDKSDSTREWSKGTKRPLSPTQPPGRSISPPHKRRYSINGHGAPSRLSPVQTDTVPRPTSSGAGPIFSNGSQSLRRSPTSIASTPTPQLASSSNGTVSEDPAGRNQRVQTLNRELWDLRRQTTALKAREESILVELNTLRAPATELPDSSAASAPKTPALEDKLRLLEAEVHSLRQRLQSETVRRQLVEEACENERRRRKHAEDLLDDARREGGAPLVVPAMMDAFERIAQLTGEALMSAKD